MTRWTGRTETVVAWALLITVTLLAGGCRSVSEAEFDRFKADISVRLDAVAESHGRARSTAALLAEATADPATDPALVRGVVGALTADLDAAAGALEQAREAVR